MCYETHGFPRCHPREQKHPEALVGRADNPLWGKDFATLAAVLSIMTTGSPARCPLPLLARR